MNQILHTDDAIFAERSFDNSIISKGDTLLVDLAISTFIDEFAHTLEVRVAIGDVWLDDSEHFLRCTSKTDEDTAVNLE